MFKEKELFLTIARNLFKAVLSTIIAILVVLFLSGQISKVSGSIVENKKTSFILQNRTEVVSDLRNDLKLIGEKDKKIEEATLSTDNILEFVAVLESLASQNSLQQSLRFSTPVPVANTEGISSIDYYLTLNGNILTLLNYLKNFEKLPYITGISAINFQTLTDKGWEDNSSVSIQGKLYVHQNNF